MEHNNPHPLRSDDRDIPPQDLGKESYEEDIRESNTQLDLSLFRPFVSAADAGRANYARVWFDPYIGEILEEYAKERAPSYSFRQHLVGIAGEVAVGAWQGVPINRRIMPDYEGDNGYDLDIPNPHGEDPLRIEVKTTESLPPEHTIHRQKINQADIFVLCTTDLPTRYVEIVGWAPRPLLKITGEAYGREGYLLSPENLYPAVPKRIESNEVREAMYG